MKRKKLKRDAAENRELCRKYAEKQWTVRRIAAKTGLDSDTVRLHLRALGIRAPKEPRGPLQNRAAVLKLVKKLGQAGAARQFGVSRQAIGDRLRRWGDA